ncbi:MAG: prepilin-type N-terminal cleavage/methylation domain-containing protein [Planctomycetaceae bacterium]|nr:prepilin-type N-terminal cleavage/methylation domain-containing protein [Planctomycetaceae bacterium]
MQPSSTHSTNSPRSGFTLIELLVAITIVILLMGIFYVAVIPVLTTGKESQVQSDLTSLGASLGNFKMEFHDLPPSTFTLRESDTGWTNSERAVLRRFWPNYDFSTANAFDANGNGNSTDEITMNGAECMTFFLGGILTVDATDEGNRVPSGFSKNPAAPFSTGGTRVGPFFEFNVDRLVLLDTDSDSSKDDEFKMYTDPLSGGGQPYMYIHNDDYVNPTSALSGSGMTKVYSQNTAEDVFWNAQTYQLISAGSDGVYGTGGVFDPNTADSDLVGSARDPERDNMTNFNRARLAP